MKKFNFLLLCLSIFLFPFYSYAEVVDEQNVSDSEIERQLSQDKTLVPMGKGAVFVPYLYDRELEPLFTIFRNGNFVQDAESGMRIPLDPGEYKLYIGSGAIDTRIEKKVTIIEERVSVVMPEWSALIVEIKDENDNFIQKGYQIIDENSKLNIGSGRGADIMKGEKKEVWLIEPGLYRIMKKGEAPESFRNFITVRTMEGKVTKAVMYFDEELDQLLAGGETVSDEDISVERGNWRLKSTIAGNFSLLNDGYFDDKTSEKNNYSLGATFNFSANYEDSEFLFINTFDIYEKFQKPSDYDIFDFTRDIAEINSLFVYRISKYFGPYVSFHGRTSFFLQYHKVGDSEDSVYYRKDNGKLTELDRDDYFVYSYHFSPTTFRESTGINFEFKYGTMFSMFARAGWGFRQSISPRMYDISPEEIYDDESGITDNIYHRVSKFDHAYGPEFSVDFSYMPFSFVEIKEEFWMLIPIQEKNFSKSINYMSRSIVSLWISSFASIQYEFLIERNPAIMSSVKRQHSLNVQIFYRLL